MSRIERFLYRIRNLLLHPGHEWQIIKEEQTTYGELIIGYLAFIAAIPPLAAIAEHLVFSRGIAGIAVHSPIRYVLAANVLWYFMIIINILLTGAVITIVAVRKEQAWISLRGLKLAIYSFTPAFLVCIVMVIPQLKWTIYAGLVYSVYLLYLGIRSMIETGQAKAVWYALASVLVTGLIVGTLNMFEYMFESFVANKVFF